MTFPQGPFDIVYADPAWAFSSNSVAKPGRNARRHYPCMSDGDICALPVKEISAPAALLLMWTTAPMLERSMAVPRAWGFRYKSHVIWDKGRIATGYWARNQHEILLICSRGKFPCPRPALFPCSIVSEPRREHSRKPESVMATLNSRFAHLRKVELFARAERSGWASWGNETAKFAEQA